jgi:3-hydroxyisobutyrate dehydrogenase
MSTTVEPRTAIKEPNRPVGFIGIGVMGHPMARNMLLAGTQLLVWNRTSERCLDLVVDGALVAASTGEVFARCETIILMLATAETMDLVLHRQQAAFAERVRGRTIVHMGTTSPEYSADLAADIRSAGGFYVECPVSGSRKPAEDGQLVGMMAGDNERFAELRQLLAPVCAQLVECGECPSALLMKLSVNLYLITMVAGLCEAYHFAGRHGLNPHLFQAILDAGPMASRVSRGKLEKLVAGDFSVQAAIDDVLKNNRLVADAARRASLSSPLLDASHALFSETVKLGHGALDMVAVLKAIEARTSGIERSG